MDCEVKEIYDKKEMAQYIDVVWDLLQKSYANKGGFHSAHSKERLLASTDLMCLCLRNGIISAVRVYRQIENGFKFNGSAANVAEFGDVAKSDLKNYLIGKDAKEPHLLRWGEVSGVIEHWMKTNGGSPIPNSLALEILPNPKSIISLDEDKQHYTRKIGIEGKEFVKCIYGFPSEDLIKKLYEDFSLSEFDDYPQFKDYANGLPTPTENESKKHIKKILKEYTEYNLALRKWAISVIATIDEYNCDGLNEMPMPMFKKFEKAVAILENDDQENPKVITYLKMASIIKEFMPPLILHKFSKKK